MGTTQDSDPIPPSSHALDALARQIRYAAAAQQQRDLLVNWLMAKATEHVTDVPDHSMPLTFALWRGRATTYLEIAFYLGLTDDARIRALEDAVTAADLRRRDANSD